MWPKGYEIRWFRREMPRKVGPSPPQRPGFGQTPLKVMHAPQGYYIGTAFVLPDGSDKPYTVESDYFSTKEKAEQMFKLMTGKRVEEYLRKSIRTILTEI